MASNELDCNSVEYVDDWQSFIAPKKKPEAKPSVQNCMLGLIHDQVWMGSKDSIIYIIDTVSMSCNQQLTEHRQEVTCLAVDPQHQNGRLALLRFSHFLLWIVPASYNECALNSALPTTPPPPTPPTDPPLLVSRRTRAAAMAPSCSGTRPVSKWRGSSRSGVSVCHPSRFTTEHCGAVSMFLFLFWFDVDIK